MKSATGFLIFMVGMFAGVALTILVMMAAAFAG